LICASADNSSIRSIALCGLMATPWPGGTAGWLNSEDLARATGSSSMISLRNQETWGEGGSDPVARNEWMCILHANQGAQAQVSKAELTPRCSGTYGQNRRLITAGLRIQSFQQGRSLPRLCNYFSCQLPFPRMYFRLMRLPGTWLLRENSLVPPSTLNCVILLAS
jgi:hypothetical protein